MIKPIKSICLLLSFTLCFALGACTTPQQGDEYHDNKLISTWEVEAWISLNRCYYPAYYTLKLNADGSAEQYIDEDQFKYNLQMSETFSQLLYPQLLKNDVRQNFYGMEKETYITHLRNAIATKLPSHIESTYGMTMEAWLDKEYASYKAEVEAGKVSAGTTYWIAKDGKVAFLESLDSFESRASADIWAHVSTEGKAGCMEYALSEGDSLITLKQVSDEPYYNSYPVTLTKIK
ncbi:MAG: hypothetical protein IKL62_03160 [Clostridia bacterium]|nr:hypothetical protein [Clostridia bacterium]